MNNESRPQRRAGQSLDRMVDAADGLRAVKKSDLHAGDWLIVKTLNSVYTMKVTEDGKVRVSGGWFDRKGLSPKTLTLAGCTWGGSVIKVDVAAACGLCIEFGNRLMTSTVQRIIHLRREIEN